MRAKEFITEAFDQPYSFKWEKGEESMDALAQLPDGSNLSIMFNQDIGQGGDDVILVEFYRNNSQEVTGEGDAQRIFSTVLAAIQQYINKYKPQKLIFSAMKDLDPYANYGPDNPKPNPESRAKLYDRLVQRYAQSAGYSSFREEHDNIVRYQLTRLRPAVTEGKSHDFMAGHCHVMAIALKQLHPDWQIRAHVGYDDDEADDTEYRVDHVYTVAPDGTAYDCRGRFDNEQQLVGPDTTGGVDTQYVNFGPEEIKQAMLRGELKRFTKQDLANAMQVATQAGKQDVSEAPAGYKEIEFVCVNPQFPDATDPALQKKMYRGLKQIDGVVPLWQEWGDYSEGQASLSAIYQGSKNRDKILSLAKQLGVEVDLEQAVSDDYVDRAMRGEHEGQQGLTEYKNTPLQDYNGLQFMIDSNHPYLRVEAFAPGSGQQLAQVDFKIDDQDELHPEDLHVEERWRGQGIAQIMYDFVKSKGYTIHRSWSQTDAGSEFWNKHRGQKRVWEQGVAEGATVTRIDSKPITDFGSSLKAYKHTDDWSQSGVDTGDDSYWKNKNLKTNTTKGLFAGDPKRTALYATGNAHETRYVEFTQDGQPIVYFDRKDLPAMRSRKTYLTVFDASDFRQLPTGEWFSENPSKPIKQIPISDPFKYIASQGWIVRVTDDLDKVFKQVKNMHKAGKIAQYGAEGMNENKQGVAESLDQLSQMFTRDQAERNEFKKLVKTKAGGDYVKGGDMYAQLKNRPRNDIFGGLDNQDRFMKMKFDFDKFTIDDWNHYWTMAQHCDNNRDFQRQALATIEKYEGQDPRPDQERSHYQSLYDRISCGTTGTQKYGTQDICNIDSVSENFADGRNPQDKGDAKRHGINTKASVSSLRKTAKQGGRKGQLAHWLANMKSGRAKKK